MFSPYPSGGRGQAQSSLNAQCGTNREDVQGMLLNGISHDPAKLISFADKQAVASVFK